MCIDSDILAGLGRLSDANAKLENEFTRENGERVCIETRAVYTTFGDIMSWTGEVDAEAQQKVLSELKRSETLLRRAIRVSSDPKMKSYRQAVAKRVRGLGKDELTAILT